MTELRQIEEHAWVNPARIEALVSTARGTTLVLESGETVTVRSDMSDVLDRLTGVAPYIAEEEPA